MKNNILFILFSVLIMIVSVIYIAIDINNKKMKEFIKDGYILTTENTEYNNKTARYYFQSGTKYKEKYEDKVAFLDVDGNKISLNNAAFVHYLDGSVSTLKKGVVMDLDSINGSVVKYYNIFPKSILEKRANSYFINNLDKQLKFTNFIVKTSDTKYLIASEKITLSLSDNQAVDIKDYVEINFIDGNIIRLENQEVSYQTISSESYIKISNDIKLNLGNNSIYVGDEKKVTLDQMIIDSNDNIEIKPEEPKEEEKDDDSDNGNSGNQVNNGINGGVNGGIIDDEQVVDEAENTQIPVFTITNLEVTSNKLDTTVSVTDEDNSLTSGITFKIIENDTGKTIYMKEEENGKFDIDILLENLNPETNYTLIATATYNKNDIDYTKDFLSKSFRTESLGIDIYKNYYTTSELSYKIKVDEYSHIKSATLFLYDNEGTVIDSQTVESTLALSSQIIIFNNLDSNTNYKLKLTDFHYDNFIISDGYEVEINAKTLKKEPNFGRTSFNIDKRNSLFTLNYNNVVDNDGGIISYRYEVYNARIINTKNPQPIKIIEKNHNSSVDISVDEINIFRGDPYVFRVVVEFYDNEKYIEYASPYSTIMQMDGVDFPTVNFEEELVTFERIKGKLVITDDGNTIDLSNDKKILVIYQNSLGHSTTITSGGNLTIPLDINNLRANETYTISIYGTVDLQDGNDVIDNCFIGSVVVKTEETKPLVASLSMNDENIDTAFNVEAKLGSEVGVDNELEANTLSGITFNLYEGQSTNQRLVRSVKKVDYYTDPYASNLKEDYYDKSFNLTPSFFSLSNSDISDGYYTIEITNAYDYTTYENNINVKNSTITVKTNGVIPDLPINPENAISVTRILNKNAGSKYREDLSPNTVVGYEVQADYNNSKKYAKYLKYYVHDAVTDEIIESATKVYNIDTTGEIEKVYFYLEDGTNFNVKDDNLARGNRYYFTYEAYLDMNEDGDVDLKWPTGDTILKSTTVVPEKQAPIFQFYLSSSDSNSMLWKYTYSDIDNALVNKTISYEVNKNVINTLEITETSKFKSVELNNLTEGDFSIFSSIALIKNEEDIAKKYLARQHFDGVYKMPSLTFRTNVDVNHLIISINNYAENERYINRISALKVTFNNGHKEIIKDKLILDNDSVIIDLIDIAEFINQDINVKVEAYYDTGIAGFETKGDLFALQNTLVEGVGGEYYVVNARNNLTKSNQAKSSIFTRSFTLNTLTINDVVNNRNKVLNLDILETGIEHNYENINLKKLDVISLNGDGTEDFNFDMIIAGVSLLDDNGKLNIAPSLQKAKVKIKLYGAGASTIKNNIIYMKVYEFDETNHTSKEIKTIEIATNDLDDLIEITELLPKTNYYLKLYAEVYNGTSYDMVQLYDINSKSANEQYNFSTLYSVGISDINIKYDYDNSTYGTKNIMVNYKLSETIGYDRIEYKLYKIIYNADGTETKQLVNLNIADDEIFKKSMTKLLPCNPGGVIEFGSDYEIVLSSIAVLSIDGKKEDCILDENITKRFTLDSLRKPFIGVNSTSKEENGNYKIEYKVNIFDMDKVIVDGLYSIRIFDENNNDITPKGNANQNYNISNMNKAFVVDNLEVNTTYRLEITTYIDLDNSGTNFTKIKKSFNATTVNDYGIDVGTIYTVPNYENRAQIDLNFYNSYRIDYIDEIRYSIYGQSGYSIDGRMKFTPKQVSYDQGYYYSVTLDELLPSKGVYYIEMQFIYNDIIIKQKSTEHNYTE